MAATVEATFKLLDKVTAPLRGIRNAGVETTKSLTEVGKSVDKVNNHVGAVKETEKSVKSLGNTGLEAGKKIETGMNKAGRAFVKNSEEGSAALTKLQIKLKETERLIEKRKKFNIDTGLAEAKIRILKQEIRTIETTKARAELSNLGLVARQLENDISGGGSRGPPGLGGGGAGGGGLLGAIGGFIKGIPLMAAVAVAALPAIVALGGALTALGGSLGAATLGAGAVGVGGFGALIVGLGSVIAVAKPAMTELKKVQKAQDAYNKSVTMYGRQSSQAAKAHKAYMAELKKAPPGSAQLLQNKHQFGQQFRKLTQPAQASFIGMANDTIQQGASVLPEISVMINANLAAVRTAVHDLIHQLTSPEFMHIWSVVSHTFQASVVPFAHALGNIALWFGHIARAASPDVIRMFQHLERSSAMWAQNNANLGTTQNKIHGLVDQTKAWWGLIKSVGRLLGSLFGSGAQQGMSMVQGMTKQLDKWSTWIDKNPGKMHDFFNRSIEGAKNLAGAVGTIVSEVGKLGDQLLPVLSILSTVTGFGAQSGLIGPVGAFLVSRRLGKMFGNKGAAGAIGAGEAAALGAAGAGGFRATRGFAGMRETYGIQRALGAGPRAAAITAGGRGLGIMEGATGGGVIRGGLGIAGRVAAKTALPLAAIMGLYDFATTKGNFGQRSQAVASGLTFGLIPHPELGAQSAAIGQTNAANYIATHPHAVQQMRRARQIQGLLAQTSTTAASAAGYARSPAGVRGGAGAAVPVVPVVTGPARARLQAELDKLKPVIKVTVAAEQTTHATKMFDDISNAFGIRLKKGSKYALSQFRHDLTTSFKGTGDIGKRVIAQNTVDWAEQLSHGTKKQKAIAQQLRKDIISQYKQIGQTIDIVGGNIITGTQKDWGRIQGLMSSATEKALEDVTKGFTQIQQQAVSALELMGYSHSEAHNIVAGAEKKGAAGTASRNALNNPSGVLAQQGTNTARTKHHAIGGRVGGHGYTDNQNIGPNARGAPGELVLNAAQERAADTKLGAFGALERITQSYKTMHGVTKQQNQVAKMARHASGGQALLNAALSSRSGAYGGVTPAIASLIRQLDSKGFHHGSTTGGTHASGSYHYKGEAVDYGDASNNMQRLWSMVFPQRRKFAELFGPASMHPGPTLMHYGAGFSDAGLQAEHNNHIHMALAGGAAGKLGAGMAGGGMGLKAQQIKLKRLLTGSKGVPGALAQSGLDTIQASLEKKVNKKLGAAVGGGLAGFSGGGTAGANQALGKKMMLAMGWGANQWGPLQSLWTQESGWNQNARNPSSGAYGIPQALGHGNVFGANPADQIRWGLHYIKQRYGSPAGAWAHEKAFNWYGKGGRIGYVGDSLGVGTSPYLKQMEKHLTTNAVVGRSSASGVGALKSMLAKGTALDKLVFDLGTNDGSAGLLGSSLSAADRLTGGAQIYVPTVRGPGAAGKNALLQRMAGGDIHLVPWASKSKGLVGGDGIHATGAGYKMRAHMLETAMAGAAGANRGGVWDWGGSFSEGGSFTAHRPTIIGVGDSNRGPERVTVGQAAASGSSDRPIHVEVKIGQVNNHQDGDISKHVEREMMKVAKRLRSGTLDEL